MAASDPQALLDMLFDVARTAAREAAGEPGQIEAFIDARLAEAQQAATALAPAARDELEDLAGQPDWFGLLVFGLVRLARADPRLSVGVAPSGPRWSKAITLSFTEAGGRASIALALFGPGAKGVVVEVDGGLEARFGGEPPTLRLHSSGAGMWAIPLDGPVEPPATAARCSAEVRVPFPRPPAVAAGVTVEIGTLAAEVALSESEPLWTLDASASSRVALTPSGLFAGIAVAPLAYAPTLRAAHRRPPVLDLAGP